jgi:hypothetical protein
MRSIFVTILTGGVVLLLISSCATVPTEPLSPGEVRLLGLQITGDPVVNIAVRVKVLFEADGRPEIRRACVTWSGDTQSCVKVSDVEYGSPGSFSVWLVPRQRGSLVLQCYAEYPREGKAWPSNKVSTPVAVLPY